MWFQIASWIDHRAFGRSVRKKLLECLKGPWTVTAVSMLNRAQRVKSLLASPAPHSPTTHRMSFRQSVSAKNSTSASNACRPILHFHSAKCNLSIDAHRGEWIRFWCRKWSITTSSVSTVSTVSALVAYPYTAVEFLFKRYYLCLNVEWSCDFINLEVWSERRKFLSFL